MILRRRRWQGGGLEGLCVALAALGNFTRALDHFFSAPTHSSSSLAPLHDTVANPGPLGLFAFALTCAFLSVSVVAGGASCVEEGSHRLLPASSTPFPQGVNADITENKGGTNQAACLAVFYG